MYLYLVNENVLFNKFFIFSIILIKNPSAQTRTGDLPGSAESDFRDWLIRFHRVSKKESPP